MQSEGETLQQGRQQHWPVPRLAPVLRMSALDMGQPNWVHSLKRANALEPPHVQTRCSAAAMLRTGP